MEIISDKYLESYKQQIQIDFDTALKEVKKIELNTQSFTFYTSVAVISSSKIEGEQIEVDSYVKHKMQNIEYLPELVEKPNDLFQAYLFAKENMLSKENFLQSHTVLAAHLLAEKWRGNYRQNEMLVMEHNTGKIQYEAAPYSILQSEMQKLWNDIQMLLKQKLSTEEIFYYASYIHLVFVNIHPFNDGNGRAARLLEKWFLAEKSGEIGWYIQSEKYYYHHVNEYYKNLNRLGIFYEKLDYAKAVNFLLMLPNALQQKHIN
ncbi:MAG: Fic family protein [Parafilimonas sp.]